MPSSRGKQIAFLALVLGVAALVFWRPKRGEDPRLDVPDDVRVCLDNLRAIHGGLVAYSDLHDRLPPGTGPTEFLAGLLSEGVWEDTPENRARLTCPGAGGYAVRDFATHPLARYPMGGDEPVLACDNAAGMNHAGAMNVLYADRTVRTFLLEQEIGRGTLPEGATVIPVGPDSPLPDLRKLRVD